jgi:hypothetical protein
MRTPTKESRTPAPAPSHVDSRSFNYIPVSMPSAIALARGLSGAVSSLLTSQNITNTRLRIPSQGKIMQRYYSFVIADVQATARLPSRLYARVVVA